MPVPTLAIGGAHERACPVAFIGFSAKAYAMFKLFQKLVDKAGSHASLWPVLWGSPLISLAAGWAAYTTNALRPYAPASWVFAALVGALLFSIIYYIVSIARTKMVMISVQERFYKEAERINPLEKSFKSKRITIPDLFSPMTMKIKDRQFIDCELMGPANIIFVATAKDKGGFSHMGFFDCNAVTIKNESRISNAFVFEDCNCYGGAFYRITLMIPENAVEKYRREMPGINWITPD